MVVDRLVKSGENSIQDKQNQQQEEEKRAVVVAVDQANKRIAR